MNRRVTWLLAVAATLCGGQAAAQAGVSGLRLVPTVGWYLPVQDARLVGEGTEAVWTRVTDGPMLGLRADWKPGGFPVRLRGGLSYVDSDLATKRYVGDRSCGERCYQATYDVETIAGSPLVLASVDLAVMGPRLWAAQPYAFAGGGVKHYAFQQRELSGPFAAAYPEDETDPTGHAGLGVTLRLGRYALVAEIGDYVSSFDAAPDAGSSAGRVKGTIQHDLAFTWGLRIAPW